MDSKAFDALTRFAADTASRRGFAARLGVGFLASVPFALAGNDAAAKPCRPCRRKNRKGRCKRKRPNGTPCGPDKTCQNGACAACLPRLAPCEPDRPFACCSGKCSQAQPDLYLCEPHSAEPSRSADRG
jgi:hypothetical protein